MDFAKLKNQVKTGIKLNLSGRKKYFAIYTLLFAITAFLVYFWYILADRTLIWMEDGWQQHYKALIYYSRYLRSIIKNLLLEHRLIIPNWDFSIGEGADILSSLHYYTIGDPLSVFSVFFTEENMYIFYNAAIILRMYFSGVVFSLLCFETGRENRYGVLAGSMAYAFCGWAIYAKQHPFFINPMIYFPLLILGIEKIIRKKRPYLFITAVALSALSNFYFFYMMVLAAIIYVLIRTVLLYRRNIKAALLLLIRIGASSVLGVVLSAVIFLPIAYVFICDTRVSEDFNFHFLYPLSYYSALPQLFISSGRQFYLCISLSIPVLLAVFLMFYKRKRYALAKMLFITCIIIIICPLFGQLFNGFTYVANRWVWAFILLCAYILASLWSSLMELNAKEGVFLFKCCAVYCGICFIFEESQNEKAFISLALAFILIFMLTPLPDGYAAVRPGRKPAFALLITLLSIIINAHWGNSFYGYGEAGAYLEVKQLTLNINETSAVEKAAALDDAPDFYRYSGRSLTKNANIIAGISSTEAYWSLTNPKLTEYRTDLSVLENRSFDVSNYDDRAGLTTLASTLYYVTPQSDSSPAPYGFTHMDNIADEPYKVYRNEYALPLAYTYDSHMDEASCSALSPAEKEEVMLQSAILSEDTRYVKKAQPSLSSYELPYTITCESSEVTINGNKFVTTNENVDVTISFDAAEDSEIYFYIEGLDFTETPKYDLYYGDAALDPLDLYNDAKWDSLDNKSQEEIKKIKLYWSPLEHDKTSLVIASSAGEAKTLNYSTRDYDYYGGRHDFAAVFSSDEEAVSSLKLSFQLRGVYSFDSIRIICQPMDNYASQIEKLKENTLENLTIGTDSVTGSITLNEPKLLCFSIPYSIGWSAYVDGQEAKLYQANIMHMAIELDSGYHEIELRYETPFLKAGVCISIFGAAIFIVFIFVNERRLRKNKEKSSLKSN